MRTTIIALALLAVSLTTAPSQADYDFTETYWDWYLDDYPRWHYEWDSVLRYSSPEYYEFLMYVQFELYLLENTLIEPNVLQMELIVILYDEDFYGYFDIHPGDTYIEEQVSVGMYSDHEGYYMVELNTIPEGEGWVVFDEDNSWVDRFTDTAVEPSSLGPIKALFGSEADNPKENTHHHHERCWFGDDKYKSLTDEFDLYTD